MSGRSSKFSSRKTARIPFRSRAERIRDEEMMRSDLSTLTRRDDNDNDIRGQGCTGAACVTTKGRSVLTRPVLVMSVGFVVGALIVNWLYCRYPPADCCGVIDDTDTDDNENDDDDEKALIKRERTQQTVRDRRERTLTGGAIGAVASLLLYFFQSSSAAPRNVKSSNDDIYEGEDDGGSMNDDDVDTSM